MGLFSRRSKKDAPAAAPREAVPREDAAPPTTAIPRLSAMGAPMWSGRSLRLPHPPTVEFASRNAAEFAASIDVTQIPTPGLPPLDFSVESLRTIDHILGELEQIGTDETAEVVFLAGFYVGDVLVRQYRYEWIDVPAEIAPHFGFAHAVQGPRGNIANALGKAFKRVENGPEDSVAFFVEGEIAGDTRAADVTPPAEAQPATTPGAAYSGGPLGLQHPPTAAAAAAHAQVFVDAMAKFEGVQLDFSQESLAEVDRVLGGFEELGSHAVATSLFEAGCYVGEVMVRVHGYHWVDLGDDLKEFFDFRLVVKGPNENFANPIGKAFKRVDNGPGDSVAAFVRGIIASASRD